MGPTYLTWLSHTYLTCLLSLANEDLTHLLALLPATHYLLKDATNRAFRYITAVYAYSHSQQEMAFLNRENPEKAAKCKQRGGGLHYIFMTS